MHTIYILGVVTLLALLNLSSGQDSNGLKCYTCAYVENHVNRSKEGCELDRPPAEYIRNDCFGFGDLQVAGDVRHSSNGTHHVTNINEIKQVRCVKITGETDNGDTVILRGCETHYMFENETFEDVKCRKKREYDFPMVGVGSVRNVERCYCEGDACNESVNIFASMTLLLSLCFLSMKLK